MPIPVGESGNVDSEGGETDGAMHPGPVERSRWVDGVSIGGGMRVWLEPSCLQRGWAVRRIGAAPPLVVECSVENVLTVPMGPTFIVEEQ